MKNSAKQLHTFTKEELITLVHELMDELKTKSLALYKTRQKLVAARKRLSQCKDTVTFQRQRIVELHK